MPHCIIEYAKQLEHREPQSLDIPQLMAAVHAGALGCGLFHADDIKTRAIAYEHFQNGSGQQPFIHVTVRILAGRTAQQKAALSSQILAALQQWPLAPVSLTVEVVDIDTDSYAKSVA